MRTRGARHRPAFAGRTTVTVRGPACRARLAEAWPTSDADGQGWDGITFWTSPQEPAMPWDVAEQWTCQRCRNVEPVDRTELHRQLAAANGPRPEVVLGQGYPAPLDW